MPCLSQSLFHVVYLTVPPSFLVCFYRVPALAFCPIRLLRFGMFLFADFIRCLLSLLGLRPLGIRDRLFQVCADQAGSVLFSDPVWRYALSYLPRRFLSVRPTRIRPGRCAAMTSPTPAPRCPPSRRLGILCIVVLGIRPLTDSLAHRLILFGCDMSDVSHTKLRQDVGSR